jgi:hypothetical protein
VSDQLTIHMRTGEIMRTLSHGTVMIWDPVARRAYPYYNAGHETFRSKEPVTFTTDVTDTIVLSVAKAGGSEKPRPAQRRAAAQSQREAR